MAYETMRVTWPTCDNKFVAGEVSGHWLVNDLPILLLLSLPQNLAVLGGNDPHSFCVTGRCASMNTLRPNIGGWGWTWTNNAIRRLIYSQLGLPIFLHIHDISLVLSCRFVNNVANTDKRVAVISDSVGRTLTVE